MGTIWMAAFEVGINALAFAGNNYALSKTGSGGAEVNCKGHDLAEGKLQEGKCKWNEDKMKWLEWLSTIEYLWNKYNPYMLNLIIRFLPSMIRSEKQLIVICYGEQKTGKIGSLEVS